MTIPLQTFFANHHNVVLYWSFRAAPFNLARRRMMRLYSLLSVLVLSATVLAADADKQKLFTVPNMPPLGANKWSAAPTVIPLILANEAELPKGVPPAEPVTLNGELPLLDPKGKPIVVRREKDA